MMDFIWAHKYELIEIALLVTVTLITIFKKKVKTYDGIKSVILSTLPHFITLIEQNRGKKGDEKLKACVLAINVYLKSQFPEFVIGSYDDFITENIEQILSTPQKKEVSK